MATANPIYNMVNRAKRGSIYKGGVKMKLENLTEMELVQLWDEMIGEKGREGERIHDNIPDHFNHWFNESTPWEIAFMVSYGKYDTDDRFFTVSEENDLISFDSLDSFRSPFDMNELEDWITTKN